MDIVVVILLSSVLFVLLIRKGRRRILTAIVLSALSSVLLEAWARQQAPARSRTDAVLSIDSALPTNTLAGPPSGHSSARVLVVGIDGFDWGPVAMFLRHGKLPAIRSLLTTGAYYQLDNLAKDVSPGIWSALNAGRARTGVGGFTLWTFLGVRSPISSLPHFAQHPPFLFDKALSWSAFLGFWSQAPVSSAGLTAPPVWTVATQLGRQVGVVDPVPFLAVPGFQLRLGPPEVPLQVQEGR